MKTKHLLIACALLLSTGSQMQAATNKAYAAPDLAEVQDLDSDKELLKAQLSDLQVAYVALNNQADNLHHFTDSAEVAYEVFPLTFSYFTNLTPQFAAFVTQLDAFETAINNAETEEDIETCKMTCAELQAALAGLNAIIASLQDYIREWDETLDDLLGVDPGTDVATTDSLYVTSFLGSEERQACIAARDAATDALYAVQNSFTTVKEKLNAWTEANTAFSEYAATTYTAMAQAKAMVYVQYDQLEYLLEVMQLEFESKKLEGEDISEKLAMLAEAIALFHEQLVAADNNYKIQECQAECASIQAQLNAVENNIQNAIAQKEIELGQCRDQVEALRVSIDELRDIMEAQAREVWYELGLYYGLDAYEDFSEYATQQAFITHFPLQALTEQIDQFENDVLDNAEYFYISDIKQLTEELIAQTYGDIATIQADVAEYVPAEIANKVLGIQTDIVGSLPVNYTPEGSALALTAADLWSQISDYLDEINDCQSTFTELTTLRDKIEALTQAVYDYNELADRYQFWRLKDDATEYSFDNVGEMGYVVLERDFVAAPAWNTVCLPFDMTAQQVKTVFGDDAVLADFTGLDDDNNFCFKSATAIEANHPYLLKVTNLLRDPEIYDVIMNPVEYPVIDFETNIDFNGGKAHIAFHGTYIQCNMPDNFIFLTYYDGKNGFYYSNGNITLNGYRGYFDSNAGRLPELGSARLVIDGAATDSIESLNIEHSTLNTPIYDLQGRRVEKPGKGLYIINNKKVYIK